MVSATWTKFVDTKQVKEWLYCNSPVFINVGSAHNVEAQGSDGKAIMRCDHYNNVNRHTCKRCILFISRDKQTGKTKSLGEGGIRLAYI